MVSEATSSSMMAMLPRVQAWSKNLWTRDLRWSGVVGAGMVDLRLERRKTKEMAEGQHATGWGRGSRECVKGVGGVGPWVRGRVEIRIQIQMGIGIGGGAGGFDLGW